MADTNYVLDLIIQAQNNATTELNKIGENIDSIKDKSLKMSESTKKTLQTIGVTATAVTAGVVALGKSFIDASMENEPIQKSFERLSESANIASDEMIKAMRKASRGTVSDTKLMSAANKAYSLGIVKSADDMATMMEIARVKGQAMGRTMEEALDDIVTGLGRGSAQILDNLGIVVKSSDAYEQYANSIGKAVGELTEEEKKLALVNAVVSQGKEELEAFGEVPLTMAERVAQLNTARENTQNTIGDALVPVFEKLLNVVQPIIDKIAEFVSNHAELVANVLIGIGAVAGLTAVFSGLALAIPTIATAISVLTGPIGMVVGAIGLLATAWINDRGGIQEKTNEAVGMIKGRLEPFIQRMTDFRTEHGETIKIYTDELLGRLGDILAMAFEGMVGTFQATFDALDIVIALFQGDREGFRESVCKFGENMLKTLDKMLTLGFGDTWTNIKNGVTEFADWCVSKINRMVEKVEELVQRLKNAWKKAKERLGGGGSDSDGSRAVGGPVYSGQTYLVGEQGPELFTPTQNGNITTNSELKNAGGLSSTINLNFGGVVIANGSDEEEFANNIIEKIKRELELNQKAIY